MGTVIQLKEQINNSYSDLVNSVEDKLALVEEKISAKLISKVDHHSINMNEKSDYFLNMNTKSDMSSAEKILSSKVTSKTLS